MAGQGRKIVGLALCQLGFLGVCLTSGLPMWRKTNFVGANVVTTQSAWDGLWLHCVVQATGQMQCKSHNTSSTLTSDIQAGRILTLFSIIAGLVGFMVALLGGGVIDCSGEPPSPPEPLTNKKGCILGGALCFLSGVLCLVSVTWSATVTTSIYHDMLVFEALKREVGSSVYIGLVSSLLLLLGGVLLCFVRWEKVRLLPSDCSHLTCTDNSTGRATTMSDIIRSNSSATDPSQSTTSAYVYHVYSPESLYSQVQEGYARQYAVPYSWAHVHI